MACKVQACGCQAQSSEEAEVKALRDFDGSHRVEGFEHLQFSTEQDARNAIALAKLYSGEDQLREYFYRRAAERAKVEA